MKYIWLFLLNFTFFIAIEAKIELSHHTGKFSCFDEEYIILDLCNRIPNINTYYVDIGAGDGVGWSNTARLALCGWSGFALEGDSHQVAKFEQMYRNIKDVTVCEGIVTPNNICNLLQAAHVPGNFGVLNLDIDSYDYFVLEALLEKYRPTIIVAEINESIPPPLEFTVLYNEGHQWDQHSHFYGQSICQLNKLCLAKNYCIVGLEYINAILVDRECYDGPSLTAQEAYLKGYQLRTDRRKKFPWNKDMEGLFNMTPENAIAYLNQLFVPYEGKYSLSSGN